MPFKGLVAAFAGYLQTFIRVDLDGAQQPRARQGSESQQCSSRGISLIESAPEPGLEFPGHLGKLGKPGDAIDERIRYMDFDMVNPA